MRAKIVKLALASLAAALACGVAAELPAQEKKEKDKPAAPAAPEAKPETRPKRDTAPFRGRVVAVDKTEMTIKIGQRTFQMTSSTRITKAGKPATFDEVGVGDMVTGQYRKTAEGKLELLSLRIVPGAAKGQEGDTAQENKEKTKE